MKNTIHSILLVDDEKYTLEFLSYNLSRNGFEVYTAYKGSEAIEKAKKIIPNVIVLDIMMPEMDGIEICQLLRKISSLNNTIIAFLSARGEDYTQIAGFEAGADDYIKKPIRIPVLISRINALLNRVKRLEDKAIIEVGDMKIVQEKFLVIKKNKQITLPKRQFEMLALLAKNPKKVYSREEIFSKIWGDNSTVDEYAINVHISRIRSKLGVDSIKTVKGFGYRIN